MIKAFGRTPDSTTLLPEDELQEGLDVAFGTPSAHGWHSAFGGLTSQPMIQEGHDQGGTVTADATLIEVPPCSCPSCASAALGGDPDEWAENGSGDTSAAVAASGNQNIDGLLRNKWADGSITYSDPDAASDYQVGYHSDSDGDGISAQDEGFSQLSAAQLLAVHFGLNDTVYTQPAAASGLSVEGFTNLSVAYAGSGLGTGTIRPANSSDPGTAYAYYPSSSSSSYGGDAWFGPSSGDHPTAGNYDWHTVLHELGHALGLKHGQDSSVYGALPAAVDSMEFSVMTYRSYVGDPIIGGYSNEGWGFAQTYMMLDIAALQYMYGADYTTNSGNTVYSWSPTGGDTFIDGNLAIDPGGNRIFMTIWDGGGTDTYDLASYTTNLNIDLRPGEDSTFSSTQIANLGDGRFARGNVFNALTFGGSTASLIENAKGGSGVDTIVGNEVGNVLTGNAGDDVLTGGGGADVFSYNIGITNGIDRVTDFGSGDGFAFGTLQLQGIPLAGDNASGLATGQVMVGTPQGGVTRLHIGVDGVAGADLLIDLTGSYTSGNFSVVSDGTYYWLNYAEFTPPPGGPTPGDDNLTGTAGSDLIDGLAGNDMIRGLESNDQLFGNVGNDTLDGGAGDDVLDGGTGADSMMGGAGNDTYVVDATGDVVSENAGEGIDTVQSSNTHTLVADVENLTLTGTAAINGTGNALDNAIVGNSAANVLTGSLGNDTLDGGAGLDRMVGGAGDDTYFVDASGDVVVENADAGVDTVQSSISHTLRVNVDNLVLMGTAAINGTGNALDNVIIGNSANNVLVGRAGADTLDGGAGVDSTTYAASAIAVNVSLATGSGSGGEALGDVLTNIEGVTGSALNDTIEGDIGDNVLKGGAGVDTLTYEHATAGVTVSLGLTSAQNTIGAGVDTVSAFENLTGSEFDDVLTGSAAANVLTGGVGNDILNGGAGADTLIGGVGDDTYVVNTAGDAVMENTDEGIDAVQSSVTHTLGANVENLTLLGAAAIHGTGNALNNVITGNGANNTLNGGAGDDTLQGGGGADKLTGGAGADTFHYDAITTGVDAIADFVLGSAGDALDIRSVLVGFDLSSSDPGAFLRLSGTSNTTVAVNADGVGTDFVSFATLTGIANTQGLLDSMIADGNLLLV